MRHYTLTIILAIAFATAAYTQIDVPVDPLTGKAQIAFPLWQLKNNSVTVPITLTYNGGGLRVTESEGNAGMGWNISAGGQISREVRGLPDDLEDLADSRRGWLTGPAAQQIQAFNPSANLNSISCADELSDFNTLSTFYDNQNGSTIDTEPDVFTFSAPGVSGQFVFDQNKVVRLIPYQDIKIDYTRDATKKIASFTITTNNGVKYVFDLPLSTTRIAIDGSLDFPEFFTREYRMYSYKLMFNYTWMLKKIIDPTNQSIDFTYGTPQSTKWTKDVQIIRPPGAVISTMYSIVEEPTVVPIASIRDMTYLVNIGWTPYGVIGGISVAGPNMAGSKSFNFFYDRIRNEDDLPEVAADGNPHSIKTPTQTVNGAEEELKEPQYRSFLREFRETGSDCTPFPAYRFTYYDVNFSNKTTHLPFKYKFARDLWDYFNDKPDQVSSLVPRLYQKLSAQGNKRLRIAPHPGDAGYVATSGTDRSVNSSTVHYGSLRTVSYPSGGLAEITYEPADYYDSLANATFLGGGVRVKTVRIDDGDTDHSNDITTFYEYKRGDGQSSGKLLYPPIFGFYAIDNSNANYLLGALRSPINLAPDQGLVYSRVTQKQAGRGKSIFEYSVPGTFQETQVRDWKASYSRIARIMQDQTDEICDIVDPPPYEEFYDQTYEVCEPQDPETPRIPPPCQWVTTRIYYTVDPPPYETNCRSITTGSFCLSPGLFQNDFYSYPFAPSTNFDFERGLLQRVIRYDEANKEVSRKSFTYQRLPATPQTIKALRVEFGAGTNAPYRYYSVYELLTNASKVVSVETTTTYDNLTATTSISASSSYQYDPAHFLTRSITSLNSKGETRKVRFKYARDFASVPSPTGAAGLAIKSLNDSSRHGEVIETINSIIKGSNETVLSADITIYKNFASVGGAVLPSEKWIYSGGSGFQEAYFNGSNIFSFNGYRAAQYMDEYDSKGGLLTSHDRQGNFQTVLYSAASSLPRAFVKNARWDEVLVNPISDVVERIDAPDLLDGEQGFTTTITNPYSGEFSLSLLNAGTIRTTPVNKAPNSRYY
ncbi:MAG: hypothetical protein K2U26_00250, partial [Cyclobacteriaceae bacterium]|nr:hypothetical protein [Cyclobacteriaceae bacterium]